MSSDEIVRLEGTMNAGFERLDASIVRLARTMEAGFNVLADLIRETNSRVGDTNSRLEVTNQRLEETNVRLGRLEGRFDHFIDTAGTEARTLRRDVDDLRVRVDRLESQEE